MANRCTQIDKIASIRVKPQKWDPTREDMLRLAVYAASVIGQASLSSTC